jgi:Resolvase, N terminal domain
MEKTISAAQYLRMSTDHQQYSLDNQADTIARYAAEHGFAVVKTYSDAARSGLRLKNRDGLKQLLKDVVEGGATFRAILVYDVSRWGRFQDVDEAAHYEYLCKSSGVPVHYCAETFANDGSMSGLIMKALKRTMAGEYSEIMYLTQGSANCILLCMDTLTISVWPSILLSKRVLRGRGRVLSRALQLSDETGASPLRPWSCVSRASFSA